MSFQTKVTSKFPGISFANLIDDTTLARIQSEVIEGNIKQSIEVGLSPVEGFNRFSEYADAKKYPGKKKASRPVNLYLSGEMLSYYTCAQATGQSIFMGILSDAPQSVVDRAEDNNFGTKQGVAVRRFIPGPGETYKIGTMTLIRKILADRILELIQSE